MICSVADAALVNISCGMGALFIGAWVTAKKEKENYVGSETPPISMKEKETLWSEVPYVYPHQDREGREACLENPTTGFHTTSSGAKNQTHPPTRSQQVSRLTSSKEWH